MQTRPPEVCSGLSGHGFPVSLLSLNAFLSLSLYLSLFFPQWTPFD